MTQDLDIIDPPARAITFAGREVMITPLTTGQIPGFARSIKPLMGLAERIDNIGAEDLLDIMADYGDNIIEASALASGIPIDDIRQSSPIDMLPLVRAIIEINQDFFARRLAQALQAARPQTPSPGAGLTR